MPLANGTLADLVKTMEMTTSNIAQLARMVLKQMLLALAHLESKNIVHLDIKPENIFYRRRQPSDSLRETTFYLADFGLARYLDDGFAFSARAGYTMFMSPEYCENTQNAQRSREDADADADAKGGRRIVWRHRVLRKNTLRRLKKLTARGRNRKQRTAQAKRAVIQQADLNSQSSSGAAADVWALFATIAYIHHPDLRPRNLDAYPHVHEKIRMLRTGVLNRFHSMAAWKPDQRKSASTYLRIATRKKKSYSRTKDILLDPEVNEPDKARSLSASATVRDIKINPPPKNSFALVTIDDDGNMRSLVAACSDEDEEEEEVEEDEEDGNDVEDSTVNP